jgi:hypothetical protein
MRPEIFSAVAGVVLLVVASLWRRLAFRRARNRLARALNDRDPALRRAAVLVATEQGLRPYARVLLAHGRRESDPDVTAALVDGVLRNTWEPADRRAILALRLWAHAERERRDQTDRPLLRVAAEPGVLPIRPQRRVLRRAVGGRSG